MSKQSAQKPALIDAATLRRLAVKASCDPRTIKAVSEGVRVRGLAGERAREVLIEEGYEVPDPPQETQEDDE